MTRKAIVTGASSGIGRATAVGLARAGCDVGITFNTNSTAAEAVREEIQSLGRRASIVRLDCADPAIAARAVDELVSHIGGVDVLVNNAGVNRRARVFDETASGWHHTLAVNLISPWACARAAAAHMIRAGHGGRILNVTSVLAQAPIDGGAAYCASKAGLELLTKVMALELAEYGITVNAVAPGHAATPMNFSEEELTAETAVARPVIPAARPASPDEIAETIAFLASPEASYTTGACVVVDGGLLLASGPESLQREIGLPPERLQGR